MSFTIGDVFTGSLTTGRIQATEYRQGVLYQINVSNGGSGYTVAPTITISGGNPSAGAVAAQASCTIANGTVVTVTINDFGGYIGGVGYTTQPTITFAAPPGAGVQAQGNALIESRLYGNIVNNIKIEDTDTIDDSTSPSANTVNLARVVLSAWLATVNTWKGLRAGIWSIEILPESVNSTSALGTALVEYGLLM